MAWTNPSNQSQSDLITAAIWNQNVVANPQFLYDNLGILDAKIGYSLLASPATFSFTSLSTSYDSLLVTAYLRSTLSGSGNNDNVRIRFNNDTGSTYQYNYTIDGAASATGTTTYMPYLYAPTADATALVYCAMQMFIPRYSQATYHKTVLISGAEGYTLSRFSGGGTWVAASPAAITRIDISPLTGTTFAAGSEVAIYGMQSI